MHPDEEQVQREYVNGLLRHLDHPVPPIDAEAVARRARQSDARRMRWAASVLLVVGVAGVAVAAPGSPVRDWVRNVLGSSSPRETRPAATVATVPQSELAGLSVDPREDLVIQFTMRQPSGAARIALTDESQLAIRTSATAATFTAEEGRVVVENRGAASGFEIGIPRSARRVEIRVAGIRVFLKDGERIVTQAAADSTGTYSVSLAP